MIDTGNFFYNPNREEIQEIKNNFKPLRSSNGFTWFSNSRDNGIMMNYKPYYNRLSIRFNPKIILNKNNITDNDYIPLVNKIDLFLERHFSSIRVADLKLSRIDFKKDINTKYKDIYIEILKRLAVNYRRKNKKVYKTSVYYTGTSYNLNLYDKEEERKEKKEYKEEYKNILRLEIQIKRTYLRNLLNKHALVISLENFFDSKMRAFIFNEILSPLIHSGDYFTIEESKDILRQHYSENMTEKLVKFQEIIYESGMIGAKKFNEKFGDKKTYYSYLVLLKSADVNPITFQDTENIKRLPNLMKYLD